MTRHDEIRRELRELYRRALRAAGPHSLKLIETRIASLESEAACIPTTQEKRP